MVAAADQATEAPYQELQASAGTVDLAVVQQMQDPVEVALAELEVADSHLRDASSPWLLPPVADPLGELQGEVADARHEADLAADALAVTPALFGGQGARDYLVLFTSPSESRNLGGFVGAYGVLHADGGDVDFTTSGGVEDITEAPGAQERTYDGAGAGELEARYGRFDPTRYAQNLSISPDLATDAALARSVYEQATGVDVAGVLVVDPYGLAGLLELTGPVDVEGLDTPVDATNVAPLLLHEQYLTGEARADRKDQLEAVADATFDALTERDLPGPATVGRALGPVVEEKRLLFFPFADDENAFFDAVDATGRFEAGEGQLLSLRSTNAIGNKADWFLHRDVEADLTVDPETGLVLGTIVTTLRNDAPPGGLPAQVIGDAGDDPPVRPAGTNEQYLSIYGPFDVESVTVDGVDAGVEVQQELGTQVATVPLVLPPESTTVVQLEVTGDARLQDGRFVLDLLSQPLVNADDVEISLQTTDGWHLEDAAGFELVDGVATWSGPLRTDQRLEATVVG